MTSMKVARCGHCQQMFEVLDDVKHPEQVEEIQAAGLMPSRRMFLCPPCWQGAKERGRPPAPPEPPAAAEPEEAPPEEPSEEEPSA